MEKRSFLEQVERAKEQATINNRLNLGNLDPEIRRENSIEVIYEELCSLQFLLANLLQQSEKNGNENFKSQINGLLKQCKETKQGISCDMATDEILSVNQATRELNQRVAIIEEQFHGI